jgi:hypothetical protein
MSIRDILSSNKIKNIFPIGTIEAKGDVLTLPVDLSLGTTAHFFITAAGSYETTGKVGAVVIQYADDLAFTVNVEDDPLDATTNLSTLGNEILNIDVGNHDYPVLLTSVAAQDVGNDGAKGGLPMGLSSYIPMIAVNVLNPLGTKRYCRVKLTFTDAGSIAVPIPFANGEPLVAYGLVGPVAYKNSDGGIA